MGCKGREVTQMESFIHHTLSGESSISMQQNAHNLQYIHRTIKKHFHRCLSWHLVLCIFNNFTLKWLFVHFSLKIFDNFLTFQALGPRNLEKFIYVRLNKTNLKRISKTDIKCDDSHGTDPFSVCIPYTLLFMPGLALSYWTRGLQMGRIGHHGYIDFFVCDSVQSVVRHSQMVLHISWPFVFLVEFGVKLTEDVLQWFSADIGQHIKSPSGTEQKVAMRNLCILKSFKLKHLMENLHHRTFLLPLQFTNNEFFWKFNQIVIRTCEAFQRWSSPPQTRSIYQWPSSFQGSEPHIPPNRISSLRST